GLVHWTFSNTNYKDQNGDATVTITPATPAVTWSNPVDITFGTALSGIQLNATVAGVSGGSAPGTLSYRPGVGTLLNAGLHQALTVTVTATANYNQASKTVYLDVLQAGTSTGQVVSSRLPSALLIGTGPC